SDLADPAVAAPPAEQEAPPSAVAEPDAPVEVEPPPAPLSTFERFRLRLGRARGSLGANIAGIFRRGLDDEVWEELEEALIAADVGVEASLELVEGLRDRCREEGVRTGPEALALLKEILRLELSV